MAEAALAQAHDAVAPPKLLYCSFCLKSQFEVEKLIDGHGRIYICDGCVGVCQDYIAGRAPERVERKALDEPTDRLLRLLAPIEETVQGKSNQLQTVVDVLRSREVSWARIGEALGISRQSAWERFFVNGRAPAGK